MVIKNKEARIEELAKSQEEGNSSTANSFYKKMEDPCGKCDELRKTIIKLNSHLSKSPSPICSNPNGRYSISRDPNPSNYQNAFSDYT
jgi:hypothetical protein